MMNAIPTAIERILLALEQGGYQAYLVGGCVRDRLLGFPPCDYDICTSALPEEMKACFGEGFKVYETGIKHGTLTVGYDGTMCEVTTFRTDGAYTDGRHPDAVSFTPSLEEDLSRRDFTVNAMALSADGTPIDLFGGREDLSRGIIRAVGDPDTRFQEDALRILRALRFASRLDFQIEEQTCAAVHRCKDLLSLISRERIAAELTGIVMGRAAQRITAEYADVLSCAGITPSVVEDSLPRDEIIRMSALCRTDSECVGTLKFSNQKRDAIMALIEHQSRPLPQNRAQALLLLHDLGLDGARRLCLMRDERTLAHVEAAQKSGIPYRLPELALNGSHLMNLGYRGERIGRILNRLLQAVMEERVPNRKDALLAYVQEREE